MHGNARAFVLAARPRTVVTPDMFEIRSMALPDPGDGDVLVRNLWLSVDPYMRLTMSELKGYHPGVPLGGVLSGGAVGRVEVSRSADLPVGSIVSSMQHGWREAYVAPAAALTRVDPALGPVQRFLGIYGLTGITAYGNLHFLLEPKPGETVFVSGAAGAVGSIAVQLAKIAGARVIASAGSAEKGRWLVETLGADVFIDYKREDVPAALQAQAPGGLHCYFDNVGGAQLEAAIDRMAVGGRIALCGAIANYGQENYRGGPGNFFGIIERGLVVKGGSAAGFFARAPEIIGKLATLMADGRLIADEVVVDGFENTAQAFCAMMDGANRGKMLVRLGN